jgi:hypothetical protein
MDDAPHSKSEYKRRVVMNDPTVLPPGHRATMYHAGTNAFYEVEVKAYHGKTPCIPSENN